MVEVFCSKPVTENKDFFQSIVNVSIETDVPLYILIFLAHRGLQQVSTRLHPPSLDTTSLMLSLASACIK